MVLKSDEHATMQLINATFENWFRNWRDRRGGRKRRRELGNDSYS